jgi:hypothetical protein
VFFPSPSCHFRPRVILIQEYGQLVGLVTIKDILRYQLELEHEEASGGGPLGQYYDLEAVLEELRGIANQWMYRFSLLLNRLGGGGGTTGDGSLTSHFWLSRREGGGNAGEDVVFDARLGGEDEGEQGIELRG